MDALFVLAIVGLYAVTHWLVKVVSRLGGGE
jgi:hypothetical protein